MKIGSGIQKLLAGDTHTDTHTDNKGFHKPAFIFLNKESGLEALYIRNEEKK
jgi:hypothetical protein